MDAAKKRAAHFAAADSSKRQKTAGSMSFAERMMAKMGYKKGDGLGKDGAGIATPIEVKLRPQGAGVGAVKEKTQQAKDEARRQAERRGEQYEDSSDEERDARRRRKEAAKYRAPGVPPPPPSASSRPRQKFRTAAEIEAEEGLEVPNVFKSLVDMTGQQPKLLTSAASLSLSQQAVVPSRQAEQTKLARNAQSELEAFAEAWHSLKERRIFLDLQQEQNERNIRALEADVAVAEEICAAIEALAADCAVETGGGVIDDEQVHGSALIIQAKLQAIAEKYSSAKFHHLGLDQAAVSSLTPVFKSHLSSWEPLENNTVYSSSYFPDLLRPIKPLILTEADLEAELADTHLDDSHARTAGAYESMILSCWLPKIRGVVVNQWSAHDPDPMLDLLREWQDVLPSLPVDVVVNQYIVHKLAAALQSWKPGKSRHNAPNLQPHIWLFPWLAYLDAYHLDPKSADGLLAEVKRKYRAAFRAWDFRKNGVIEGLDRWLEVKALRSELKRELDLELLPSMARHLRDNFEVDPSDQDIAPIQNMLLWLPYFRPEKLARVLIDAFFPKFLRILHIWLTAEHNNFEEIEQWMTWWQTQFPDTINQIPAVAAQWAAAMELVNHALDLGPEKAMTHLPAPAPAAGPQVGTARPAPEAPAIVAGVGGAAAPEGATFRDILEDFCEAEDLLLIPLRKAHVGTGLPLLRVTASAAGTGGAVVYIKGDSVFAQNRRNREVWDPINVFEKGVLAGLAEGR